MLCVSWCVVVVVWWRSCVGVFLFFSETVLTECWIVSVCDVLPRFSDGLILTPRGSRIPASDCLGGRSLSYSCIHVLLYVCVHFYCCSSFSFSHCLIHCSSVFFCVYSCHSCSLLCVLLCVVSFFFVNLTPNIYSFATYVPRG